MDRGFHECHHEPQWSEADWAYWSLKYRWISVSMQMGFWWCGERRGLQIVFLFLFRVKTCLDLNLGGVVVGLGVSFDKEDVLILSS